MNIPPDVVDLVRREFPADQVDYLLVTLFKASESPRIRRCIAFAAHGNADHFNHLCKLATIDYRDVIMAAEYDRLDTRLYDFNLPIDQARIQSPYGQKTSNTA